MNSSPPMRTTMSSGNRLDEDPARLDEDPVAHLVAEGVVDALEIVEVEICQRDHAARSLRSLLVQVPPIVEAGEVIGVGAFEDALFEFAFFRHVTVDAQLPVSLPNTSTIMR